MEIINPIEKMYESTNNKNIQAFKDLLPLFEYKTESDKRIIDVIDGKTSDAFHASLDLNLQAGDRLFISLDKTEETDSAWSHFINCIYGRKMKNGYAVTGNGIIYDYYSGKLTSSKITYDNFINNKIDTPELSGKLFKACIKAGILNQSELDEINKRKVNDKVYFCISRNPVDFLFASTNQSFTSCINLESEYEGAYYMSLPAMLLDTSRYICFITNGKLSKYKIKGIEFKHFKYIQRAWAIILNDDSVFVDRYYPAKKFDFKPIFDFLSIESFGFGRSLDDSCSDTVYSKRAFKPAVFTDNNKSQAFIYLDTLGMELDNGLYYYHSDCSPAGSEYCPEFNYTGGFNRLNYVDELHNEDNYFTCSGCGDREHIDNRYSNDHGEYCSLCAEDWVTCEHCGDAVHTDNSYSVNDILFCEYCYNEEVTTCCCCDEKIIKDNSYELDNDEEILFSCKKCRQNGEITECSECGNEHILEKFESIGDKYFCENCKDDFTVCEDCAEVIEKSDCIEHDDLYYCKSCHAELLETLADEEEETETEEI